MDAHFHLFLSTTPLILSTFKEQLINSLTAQQKKIASLALGVIAALAAIYLISSYYFRSSHTVRLLPTEDKKEDQNSEEKFDSRLKEAKNAMLFETQAALKTKINDIQSAKFFITLKGGYSVERQEHIIKKEDASCFDIHFLSQKIDSILDNVKGSIEVNNVIPFMDWQAVFKDKDAEFYYANGNKDGSGHAVIDTGKMEEFWKIYNDKPLLNEQMEFI